MSTRSAVPLIVHSQEPFNAEPPLAQLRSSFITAQSDLYVRCHGPVPVLTEEDFRLRVDGSVTTPLELSVPSLRHRYPARTVRAAMQCAGNRRGGLLAVAPVSGDAWSPGAIGNADWTGVALADLLRDAGATDDADQHVVLSACDACLAEGEPYRYEVSIPMRKALAPDVLLAWAMNGEALAPAHGFPLRAVVPGYAGARSPKWLGRITVQDRPSDAWPQAHDYRLFPPTVTAASVDWAAGAPINEMPLNAAICEPADAAPVKVGETRVRGYAVSGTHRVARVEVSVDGGQSWAPAELQQDDAAPWSWTLWEARVMLSPGPHELVVRAWDTAGQTQPAEAADVWNFKGYLNTSWHRIRVSAA